MSNQPKQKLDMSSLFPTKGDPRRPPEWYTRALFYAVIAVYIGWFCFTSWSKVSYIALDIVVALFLALAVEPLVLRLIRHGWRRGAASVTCLVGVLVIVVVLLALFGNLFVQQMISMVKGLPALYNQIAADVAARTDFKLPEINSLGGEILKHVQTSWVSDFAGQALSTTVGLVGGLINVTTAIMVAFYISIAGPRLRRSLCKWVAPQSQRKFLMVWTVVQGQISSFLFSRSILAAINATCMSIFLVAIKVPYWLPLALFCGVVSQFVPTIGTYLGGALPVLFAWGERGIGYAVAVVVFIFIYQQIENLLVAPKISEHTMDINPCIAFLSVLLFGSLFGAIGAFLALPITASIQVLLKVSMKQYPLVDSPLMNDPTTKKKSKMVVAADAINDHVLKPVSDHMPMPRQAKGSSAHVAFDEEIQKLQQATYGTSDNTASDPESPTMAIPKHVLDRNASGRGFDALHKGEDSATEDPGPMPAPTDDADAADADAAPAQGKDGVQGADGSGTSGTDNPRSQWH